MEGGVSVCNYELCCKETKNKVRLKGLGKKEDLSFNRQKPQVLKVKKSYSLAYSKSLTVRKVARTVMTNTTPQTIGVVDGV